MERPDPVPRCRAMLRDGNGKLIKPFVRCSQPSEGELVYDKPGIGHDISWPYCGPHLREFEPLNKDLWIDYYEPQAKEVVDADPGRAEAHERHS